MNTSIRLSTILVATAICVTACSESTDSAPEDKETNTSSLAADLDPVYIDQAPTVPPGVISQGQSAFGRDIFNPGIILSCDANLTATTLSQSAGNNYGVTTTIEQVTLRMNGGRNSAGDPVTSFQVSDKVTGAIIIAHSAKEVKGGEATLYEDDQAFGPVDLQSENSYFLKIDTSSTNEGEKTGITFCFPRKR